MPQETRSSEHEDSTRSSRQIIGTFLSMLKTRVELAVIELADEKDRLLRIFLLGLVALLLGTLALIALTALVIVVCWNTCRWQALAGLTAVYLVAALCCVMRIRRKLRTMPPLFHATMHELEKDSKLFRWP
jgi:uncharacterized membrane protein YqjE